MMLANNFHLYTRHPMVYPWDLLPTAASLLGDTTDKPWYDECVVKWN